MTDIDDIVNICDEMQPEINRLYRDMKSDGTNDLFILNRIIETIRENVGAVDYGDTSKKKTRKFLEKMTQSMGEVMLDEARDEFKQ